MQTNSPLGGLVIWYTFVSSTVTGTTVKNQGTGGSDYDATLSNGATANTMSYPTGTGVLVLVANLGQYLSIPAFTTGTAGMSFACWFRSSNTGTWGRLFDFGFPYLTNNIVD